MIGPLAHFYGVCIGLEKSLSKYNNTIWSSEHLQSAINMAKTIQKIRPLRSSVVQAVYDFFASQCGGNIEVTQLSGLLDVLGHSLTQGFPAVCPPELFSSDPGTLVRALLSLPEGCLLQGLRLVGGLAAYICRTPTIPLGKALKAMLSPLLDSVQRSRRASRPTRLMFRAVANGFSGKLYKCDDQEALAAVDSIVASAHSFLTSIEGASFICADCLRMRALIGRFQPPPELLPALASSGKLSADEDVWGRMHLSSVYLQILLADGKFPKQEHLGFVTELLEAALSCRVVLGEEEEGIVGVFVKTLWPQAADRLRSCLHAATQRMCNGTYVCGPLLLHAALSILQLAEKVFSDVDLNVYHINGEFRIAACGEGPSTS